MLPTAHFFVGILLYGTLKSFGMKVGFLPIMLGSLIVDIDIIFNKNHRNLPTHSILTVFPIMMASIFFSPLFYFSIALLLHYILDSIDYGINLKPFSGKHFGVRILKSKFNAEHLTSCMLSYISNRKLLFTEIVLAIFALGAIFI
jgi:hypothetical protein